MTAFSGHKDLAFGTVLTAPSPALSGTTIVLAAGDGAKMPTTYPWYAATAPPDELPTLDNAEVVLVTANPGGADTFTITRAQGGTTAQAIAADWVFYAGVSSEWATEVENAINATEAALAAHIADPTGAHAASAISFTPSGIIVATNVQDAIDELQGELPDLDTAVILAPATAGRNVIQPTAGDVYAAVFKAHAAQSVDLTQWQRSDATVPARITSFGNLFMKRYGGAFNTDALILLENDSDPENTMFEIATSGLGQTIFNILATGEIFQRGMTTDALLQVLRQQAVPTAPLVWMQSNGGATLYMIDKGGRPTIAAVTAPTSGTNVTGQLAASQIALWFDPTNGAPLLKATGRSADGTTYTWSVPPGTALVKELFDAKGDLLTASAADTPVILPVGANGKVLKANSATATGLEWADDSTDLSGAVILAPASSARNVIQPTLGTVIAAVVKAHASQSVDLTQWQKSDGTVVGSIDKAGLLALNLTLAAAGVALNAYGITVIGAPNESDSSNVDNTYVAQSLQMLSQVGTQRYGQLEGQLIDLVNRSTRSTGSSAALTQMLGQQITLGDVLSNVGATGGVDEMTGQYAYVQHAAPSKVGAMYGLKFGLTAYDGGVGTPGNITSLAHALDVAYSVVDGVTVPELIGLLLNNNSQAAAGTGPGVITLSKGIHISEQGYGAATAYGLYIAAQALATNPYGIYVAGGKSVFVDSLILGKTSAPADADFANSQGAWWWDAANAFPSWKGKNAGGTVKTLGFSTDGTLAGNSDALVPTQKAVKTYVDAGDAAAVPKSLYDANTILKADSDDTPVALVLAANKFPARSSSGSITAKDITDFALTLLDDPDAAAALATLGAAPSNAGYVTLAAESGLSAEAVLGTAVIMAGTLASRPAAATAGRLYVATDVNGGTPYRDTGSAWVQAAPGVNWSGRNGQASVKVPFQGLLSTAALAGTANRVSAVRFSLPFDMTVASMGWRSVGAGTGNVDVGILDAAGNRLASSGSTSGKKAANTNQTAALTAPLALTAGTVYYAVFETDANDGTIAGANYGSQGQEAMYGSTIGLVEGFIKDTTFPIPSSVALGFTSNNPPIMLLIP